MFLSLDQPVTKNQIPDPKLLFFCCCRKTKTEETACPLPVLICDIRTEIQYIFDNQTLDDTMSDTRKKNVLGIHLFSFSIYFLDFIILNHPPNSLAPFPQDFSQLGICPLTFSNQVFTSGYDVKSKCSVATAVLHKKKILDVANT